MAALRIDNAAPFNEDRAMPQTVLDWLTKRYPTAKKTTLRRMIQASRVFVNGRPARKATDAVADADVLTVDERPVEKQEKPVPMPSGLHIVFEDDDILVVDKPAGLLTSTVADEPRPTLLAKVRIYVHSTSFREARVGLIHRLDKDASGLLVFSKNEDAYRAIKKQLYDRTVGRTYVAVVLGVPNPKKGRVDTRLIERPDGRVFSTRDEGEGERAVTDYEVVKTERGMSLVRVTLLTGRKHQIRVHLSERGTPIIGDKMYGRKELDRVRLMLAAIKLSFDHPRTGERMTWEVPTPRDFAVRD